MNLYNHHQATKCYLSRNGKIHYSIKMVLVKKKALIYRDIPFTKFTCSNVHYLITHTHTI